MKKRLSRYKIITSKLRCFYLYSRGGNPYRKDIVMKNVILGLLKPGETVTNARISGYISRDNELVAVPLSDRPTKPIENWRASNARPWEKHTGVQAAPDTEASPTRVTDCPNLTNEEALLHREGGAGSLTLTKEKENVGGDGLGEANSSIPINAGGSPEGGSPS